MVSTIDSIARELDSIAERVSSNGLHIGTVGQMGNAKRIGDYFANALHCELVHLPSVMRKGRNSMLAATVNKIYPFLSEDILRILSEQYKRLYLNSERVFPTGFNWEQLTTNDSEILLVDDNAFTGKTLEMWKREIGQKTRRSVHTFSITVTGEYKPDYFCYEGWRSFEWRLIGI